MWVGDETKHMRYVTCMTVTLYMPVLSVVVVVADNISKNSTTIWLCCCCCCMPHCSKGSFHVMCVNKDDMLIMGSCPLPPPTSHSLHLFAFTHHTLTPLLGPFQLLLLLTFCCLFFFGMKKAQSGVSL